MPNKNRGVKLLLLVASASGFVGWQSAGYFSDEVCAANHGAKAVQRGEAFARRVIRT
jgi:hypothetical protein